MLSPNATTRVTNACDFLIVGDGIAGLTIALALADLGARVEVVGTSLPGAASVASAGLLAPSLEGLPDGVRETAIAARDMYPAYLESLRDRSGMDVPLDRNGILEIAASAADLATIQARSPQSEMLDAATLARLEPALAGHPAAVLHPFDGAVDNVALMKALRAAVARAAIAHVNDVVVALDASASHANVRTHGGAVRAAGHVVLAAGAWVSAIEGVPRHLQVRPLRGQLLRLADVPIRHVTYAAGGYLIPRPGGLLVGATSEDTGLENGTTADGLRALRTAAERLVPALASATVVEHWAGLRPMTPDGLPILGQDPAVSTLSYACGFSRNGILLAPYLGGLLARGLVGTSKPAPLAPFSPSRFG